MTEAPRPVAAAPEAPWRVGVLGHGRVGGSFAHALAAAGNDIVARLGRGDDLAALSDATVVVIAVPDDALDAAAAAAAPFVAPGALVIHTCGLAGLEPLARFSGPVAAIHPAAPVATQTQSFDGVTFGVTCAGAVLHWCEQFVGALGGSPLFLTEQQRPVYHAALVMASNFSVALAGDSADLLGGHQILVPLLRATVENIARLGPDEALTGPIVRGDAGTVRAHLDALPAYLHESYIANARRTLARAIGSGRLSAEDAHRVAEVLR